MKRAAAFAFLALLFCTSSASWDSLDSFNLPKELEPVNEDIIPRLLQEVLGDAAVPGAYGAATPAAATVEKATPAAATPAVATPAAAPDMTAATPVPAEPTTTTTTPAATTTTPMETPAATAATTTPAETPVTTVVQPTQPTIVEAPAAAPAVATPTEASTTPAPATTTTTTSDSTPAAAPATVAVIPAATSDASVCPAGSKRTDYSSGTLFCVLAAQGDAQGELHISNGAGKAIPSGNKCFSAPCAAPSSSSSIGRKMLARWLHATEAAQAQQRAEFLPFLLAIARAVQPVSMASSSTLAHSKCFYVCEASN